MSSLKPTRSIEMFYNENYIDGTEDVEIKKSNHDLHQRIHGIKGINKTAPLMFLISDSY